MKVIASLELMQQEASRRLERKSIGLVPTMGALHKGHLSLVKMCKAQNDITVVSIFVNPKQFGPHEDYRRYPRTLEKDLELLQPHGVDVVFNPETRQMFPADFQTRMTVEKLSEPLYGKVRPHFFGGVAVIVLKLFHLIKPTRAYFGEKDYQQLLVVRQMVKDLHLDIDIVACPIVREKNGLAMSSRNAYLSSVERENAALLYRALQEAEQAIRNGEKDPQRIVSSMENMIRRIPGVFIDYIALADASTLAPVQEIKESVFLGLAVRIGNTRLIDGVVVKASAAT